MFSKNVYNFRTKKNRLTIFLKFPVSNTKLQYKQKGLPRVYLYRLHSDNETEQFWAARIVKVRRLLMEFDNWSTINGESITYAVYPYDEFYRRIIRFIRREKLNL